MIKNPNYPDLPPVNLVRDTSGDVAAIQALIAGWAADQPEISLHDLTTLFIKGLTTEEIQAIEADPRYRVGIGSYVEELLALIPPVEVKFSNPRRRKSRNPLSQGS